MSSSSELEVLTAVRKPASPPKPRRSGRDRRAPRGVDELAAPAAEKARRRAELDLESTDAETAHSGREDDEDDASPLPEAMKPLPARTAAQSAPDASTSSVQLPTPFPSLLLLAPVPVPAVSTSSPAPRPALAPPQPKPKPQPSLRRSHTPADPASRPAPVPAPRAKPPPQTSYSSDEADDFFGARKPAPPKSRAPKVAGGGVARAGRLPSRASSGSATPRPTSPAKRARPQAIDLSSSTSDSDSSTAPRRGAGALSSSDDDDDGPGSKLKLPEWALTGRGAAVSGADRQRAANGAGRNRKRKRLGESGSEAEGAGAHEGDAQGKGKGRAKDDDGGLLELSGDDTDDSLELALAGGSKADKPRASPPMQKKNEKRAVASSSPTPPPPRKMASPRKRPHGDRLPAAGLAPPPLPSPLRLPRRALPASSSPQKDTQASHLTLSSNSDEPDYGHYGGGAGAFDDGEPPLDDTLAAIRSRLALARSAHAPAAGGSSPEKTGAAGEDDGGKVTIRLQMVFDPTRSVPEVAKRVYEKEEVFEHGLHEPFAALFYGLSVRRTIPRDDLVITHVRSSSASGAGGKPTQLYEFGTPASLSLSAGDEAHMRGYTADVWAKVRASAAAPPPEDDEDAELERAAAAAKAARGAPGALVLDDDTDEDDESAETGVQEREQGFPLTLRGSRTQSLSLAVKPSTSMAQLIKAYCRHFAIADAARQGRMWVEFDGDRLEGAMTLQEAKEELDLEGEETFEVKEPA